MWQKTIHYYKSTYFFTYTYPGIKLSIFTAVASWALLNNTFNVRSPEIILGTQQLTEYEILEIKAAIWDTVWKFSEPKVRFEWSFGYYSLVMCYPWYSDIFIRGAQKQLIMHAATRNCGTYMSSKTCSCCHLY